MAKRGQQTHALLLNKCFYATPPPLTGPSIYLIFPIPKLIFLLMEDAVEKRQDKVERYSEKRDRQIHFIIWDH